MPAEMSATSAPSFCACLTFEFMKTVQRVPRSTGAFESMALAANSAGVMCRPSAKFWMKEPQPAEHASLSVMLPMLPSLTKKHFMSWPPMSSTKVTSGQNSCAARRCANVSTSPPSACSAALTMASP